MDNPQNGPIASTSRSRSRRYQFGLGALFLMTFLASCPLMMWRSRQESLEHRRSSRDSAEQDQLNSAIEFCRLQYGIAPALSTNHIRLQDHIRRAFPRYSGDMTADLQAIGLDVTKMEPSEALTFWLGGVPSRGYPPLTGFNLNPFDPFAPGGQRTWPLFEFDKSRLTDADGDGWLEYRGSTLRPQVFELKGGSVSLASIPRTQD